jgi:hypothetical protein
VIQHSAAAHARRSSIWLWCGGVAVVAAAVLVYAFSVAGSSPKPADIAAGTPSASASATPDALNPASASPAPTPLTTSPPDAMPELPAVAPDKPSDNGKGLVTEISRMRAVQGEAVQAGEISGPAVQFTLTLTNRTDAAVDLGLIAVNAYIGPNRTPAGGLVKPGAAPFEGTLAAGKSTTGVYVFTIPEAQRSDVTLTVDYRAGQPAFVFRGDVG